jgi:hypothetical protein
MPSPSVTVRSYHSVLDRVERRLFRFDRWRLPNPTGVLLRSLAYASVSLVVVALLSGVPVLGSALGLLPPVVHWAILPVGAGWVLSLWTPDGRVAHFALRSLVRYWISPRTVASLRRCPDLGSEEAPLAEVCVAPCGDEPRYLPGRVLGEAKVALAYPAELEQESSGALARLGSRLRLRSRRRATLIPGERNPLERPLVVHVPARGEVRIR